MAGRAPEFDRGEQLNKLRPKLNQMARVVNEAVIAAPRDIDTGIEEEISPEARTLYEIGDERTVSRIRIFQDEDTTSENYVDVDRIESMVLLENATGNAFHVIMSN